MLPGGAEAEAGVAGLEAAAAEGAEASAAALEEGAGAEAKALAKESSAEAKKLKEAEAAIGRFKSGYNIDAEPNLTDPYENISGEPHMSDFYRERATIPERDFTTQVGKSSSELAEMNVPGEIGEAEPGSVDNPLAEEGPRTPPRKVAKDAARRRRLNVASRKDLIKQAQKYTEFKNPADVMEKTRLGGLKTSVADVLGDEGAALTKTGDRAAAKYVDKPTRNTFEKIANLRDKAIATGKSRAKETLESKANELEMALAKKLNLPQETIAELGKRLPGESWSSWVARQAGASSTRQFAKTSGAAALAAGQQFMSTQAEEAAAERAQTTALAGTEAEVKNLREQTEQDFTTFGRSRADADTKAQADRERHLRMLEQMARGGQSGRLASEYQHFRNRSYY